MFSLPALQDLTTMFNKKKKFSVDLIREKIKYKIDPNHKGLEMTKTHFEKECIERVLIIINL